MLANNYNYYKLTKLSTKKEKSQRMSTRLSAYVYLLHDDLGELIWKINKRHPQYSRNTTRGPNKAQKTKTGKSRGRPKNIKQKREEKNKNEKQMVETLHLSKYNISFGWTGSLLG